MATSNVHPAFAPMLASIERIAAGPPRDCPSDCAADPRDAEIAALRAQVEALREELARLRQR